MVRVHQDSFLRSNPCNGLFRRAKAKNSGHLVNIGMTRLRLMSMNEPEGL